MLSWCRVASTTESYGPSVGSESGWCKTSQEGLGLLQAKLVSEKSIELRLMRRTGSEATSRSSSVGTVSTAETVSATGEGAVLLLSPSVATSSTETVSTNGAVALLLSSPSVATGVGSGGTGGGTGGMISGGTIEGLEQIELIVRPNENPKEESQWQEARRRHHPRGQYEASEQRHEW